MLCLAGAIVMTWIFSRSLAWRVQRLKFTEHVLDSNIDAPLPDEGEETAVLNQSFRRMARAFTNSWSVSASNPTAATPS